MRGKLTVRAVEKLVRNAKERAKRVARGEEPVDEKAAGGSAAIRDLEARLTRRLGTRTVVEDKKGKGRLLISYGSLDELDRLLGLLGA